MLISDLFLGRAAPLASRDRLAGRIAEHRGLSLQFVLVVRTTWDRIVFEQPAVAIGGSCGIVNALVPYAHGERLRTLLLDVIDGFRGKDVRHVPGNFRALTIAID